MNKFLNVMRAVVLTMALGSLLQAQASVADAKDFRYLGPRLTVLLVLPYLMCGMILRRHL